MSAASARGGPHAEQVADPRHERMHPAHEQHRASNPQRCRRDERCKDEPPADQQIELVPEIEEDRDRTAERLAVPEEGLPAEPARASLHVRCRTLRVALAGPPPAWIRHAACLTGRDGEGRLALIFRDRAHAGRKFARVLDAPARNGSRGWVSDTHPGHFDASECRWPHARERVRPEAPARRPSPADPRGRLRDSSRSSVPRSVARSRVRRVPRCGGSTRALPRLSG